FIYDHFHPAYGLKHESHGRDDEVRLEFPTRFEPDAVWCKLPDLVRDHAGAANSNGVEHITIGHDANTLFPKIVAQSEVDGYIVAGAQFHLCLPDDAVLHPDRVTLNQLIDEHHVHNVFPTAQTVSPLERKYAAQPV